jgi:hypothetical protein
MDAVRGRNGFTTQNRQIPTQDVRKGAAAFGRVPVADARLGRALPSDELGPLSAIVSKGAPLNSVRPFPHIILLAASGNVPPHHRPAAIIRVALLETALDEAAWDSFSRGSAIRRAGRAGFARNVGVSLGNWAAPDAAPVLTRALSDPEPLVRTHAAWALGRVGSAAARSALSSRALVETNASVLEELVAAMNA